MSSPLSLEGVEIVEQLPGEPPAGPRPLPRFMLGLLVQTARLLVLIPLSLGLWPVYGIGVVTWGRAPNVPRARQALRYLGHAWTVRPSGSRLALRLRLWLTVEILRRLAATPLWGLAWHLDELLYGRKLDATAVVEPLFLISGARSGSTQMARYLEEDPGLVAPTFAQMMFPYLWLWRLVAATLGRVVPAEAVDRRFKAALPPELLERHEADVFRTDTFEGPFYARHLNVLAPFLGPEVFRDEFNLAEAAPHNRELWQQDFVHLLDRLGRKTLLWHGATGSPPHLRLFVKGHFLAAAEALERRYPDARVLTMLRHPSGRLRSAINFLRVNPFPPALGPPPWATIAPALAQTEARYCEVEQAWFGREGVARRCVVRFDDYVQDLEGVMATVYRECLDLAELPPHVPREHPPRRRTGYRVDRSLDQVGIDREALEARLAAYIEWCS